MNRLDNDLNKQLSRAKLEEKTSIAPLMNQFTFTYLLERAVALS